MCICARACAAGEAQTVILVACCACPVGGVDAASAAPAARARREGVMTRALTRSSSPRSYPYCTGATRDGLKDSDARLTGLTRKLVTRQTRHANARRGALVDSSHTTHV
jgi:hypothetical protein